MQVVLPAVIAKIQPFDARCRVEVRPLGKWVVDFQERIVIADDGRTCEASLSSRREDFVALVSGKLDGGKAVTEGRLVLEGNLGIIDALATILEQAAEGR